MLTRQNKSISNVFMKPILNKLAAVVALAGMFSQVSAWGFSAGVVSSAYDARNDARKISTKFMARGFRIIPIAHGDNKTSRIEFDVEVLKGTDYVFFVGVDRAMEALTDGVDLYVRDDIGNMIAQDTRPFVRAAVEFAASYNGVMTVIVDPPKAAGRVQLCHFAVMAGYQSSGY